MRYAFVFFALGALLIAQSFRVSLWWAWLAAWAGASCLLVGAAYAGAGPAVFGKRSDGTVALWARLALAPYHAFYRLLWHVVRLVGREPASHRVGPGIHLGRRPRPGDVPADVARVIDLCVEFPGTKAEGRRYVALPTLDAGVSNVKGFRLLVGEVAADDSPVYIHCASGHGRGAMFAAALLIVRGMASNFEEAEAMIRAVRPGVRLSRTQREFVRRAVTREDLPPVGAP